MVKKLLFVLMILLSLSLVSAAGSLSQLGVTTPVQGYPGDSAEFTVTVGGVGDTISSVSLISTDLTDGTNTISAPSISSVTNLASGVTQDVSFSMTIPALPAGTYTGTITATNADNSADTRTADYSLIIQSKDAFTITEDELVLSGEEETITSSRVINIENTGSRTLSLTSTDVSYTVADFTNDDLVIGLSFSDVIIAPGETGQMTIIGTIPDKMDLDTYSGTITLTEGDATDTFTLSVRVQPEVCEEGQKGTDLEMDIDNPDNDDDFAPGETIKIELNVKNEGNSDEDVKVEAFLYDLDDGDNIVDVESEVIEIEEDEDEDFTLEIEIPTEDIDEDHDYVLYVKAYVKGDEDEQCVEESIDINIEREDHAMIVKQFVLSPASATCGADVEATITVENIGSKDEDDVVIRLLSTELGLDETSSLFDVDKAGKKNDDYTVRFNFNVPKGLTETSYDLETVVTFDDGDEKVSDFKSLTIGKCAALEGQAKNVVLEVADISGEIKGGKSVSIPVKLTSAEFGSQTYKVSIDNIIDWANAVPLQTITLSEGESQTVYFYLKPQSGLDEGVYNAIVNVKSGNNLVASETLSFEVKESPGLFSGNLFGDTNIFWIIGDIVLVVVAIFFIKMIFTGRKGPKEVKL